MATGVTLPPGFTIKKQSPAQTGAPALPVGFKIKGQPTEQQTELRAKLLKSREEDIAQQIAFETSPLEAGLVAAGRGLTTIGRAVGLAEPETEQERASFERLEAESPVATTVGEIAGESAPFLVPGVGQAGLAAKLGGGVLARFLTAAGLGTAEGAAIAKGKGGNLNETLGTGGISGLAAGTLELALPVIGRAAGKFFRKLTGTSPKGAVIDAQGNPSPEFIAALDDAGLTFNDVMEDATQDLQGKVLDPAEASRKAFLESQGITPTRAQVTRTADDFQLQQELAKTSNRVSNALETQDAILTTRFNNKVLETGGQSDAPTSAVFDAITDKATTLDQAVSDLYRVARDAAPEAKNVRFANTGKTLQELAPRNTPAGGVIKTLRDDLRQKGVLDKNFKVTGKIDVDTAEEVRKLANQLFDPKNPFGNAQLRTIKDAIDDDVFRSAGRDVFAEGRKAKSAFEKELSRAKVSKFDSRKANLVRDVLENKINPDTMVDDVVFSKKWRANDLNQLKEYISTDEAGQQAFNDMRAEALESIKQKSLIGPEDAQGFRSLSRDKLQKSLDKIGPQKRAVLFTPDENKFLNDLLKVTKLREPVRGTAQGRGPSAQAVSRLERALGRSQTLSEVFSIADRQGRVAINSAPRRLDITRPSAARAALGVGAVSAGQQSQADENG